MRLFLLFSCLLAWVLAQPVYDQDGAFNLLSRYLTQYGPDENYLYVLGDHGSMKRGLGPRPLRFGK